MTKKKGRSTTSPSRLAETQKSSGAAPPSGGGRLHLPLWVLILVFVILEIAVVVFWWDKFERQMTINRAARELAAGDYASAVRDYEKLRRAEKGNASGFDLNLGHSYMGMKDYRDAIAAYKRILGLYPDIGTVNALIGKAYAEMGQWEDALPFLKKEDDRSGQKQHISNFYLGRYYFEQGNYTKAATYFQRLAFSAEYDDRLKAYWDQMEESYFSDGASTSALNHEGRDSSSEASESATTSSQGASKNSSGVASPSKP